MLSRGRIAILVAASLILASACGGDADKGTGVAEVDAVIETAEEQDAGALRDLVRFSTLPCTLATGAGGPPKCGAGEAEGTEVEVFEFYSCEVDWRRKGELDAVLQQVAGMSAKRYAAFSMHSDYLPGGRYRDAAAVLTGSYIVVLEGTDARSLPRGLAVAVASDGGIVANWLACGAADGADSMMPSGQIDFLLEPED